MDIRINGLNGYKLRRDGKDERILAYIGARRLTPTRDITEIDHNEGTLLERLLNENYPGGYNDTSDRYFIIEKDGFQYLVLEHWGQWFVGNNAANVTTGELETVEWADRMSFFTEEENKRFVRAIRRLLEEKDGRSFVMFDPSAYDCIDDIPYCRDLSDIIFAVWYDPDECGPDRIGISVEQGDSLVWETFDGSEDEDFDLLFHAVYDELYDQRTDTLEADEWLDEHFPAER